MAKGIGLGDKKAVWAFLDEIAKVYAGKEGTPEGRAALNAVSKKLGWHPTTTYNLWSGRSYTAWVGAWRRDRAARATNGATPPPPPRKIERASKYKDMVPRVLALRQGGWSFRQIADELKLPPGAVWRICNSAMHGDTKPAAPSKPKSTGGLAADIQALFDAQDEKARAELAVKHEQEMQELEKRLEARRQQVIERFVADITAPERQAENEETLEGN